MVICSHFVTSIMLIRYGMLKQPKYIFCADILISYTGMLSLLSFPFTFITDVIVLFVCIDPVFSSLLFSAPFYPHLTSKLPYITSQFTSAKLTPFNLPFSSTPLSPLLSFDPWDYMGPYFMYYVCFSSNYYLIIKCISIPQSFNIAVFVSKLYFFSRTLKIFCFKFS